FGDFFHFYAQLFGHLQPSIFILDGVHNFVILAGTVLCFRYSVSTSSNASECQETISLHFARNINFCFESMEKLLTFAIGEQYLPDYANKAHTEDLYATISMIVLHFEIYQFGIGMKNSKIFFMHCHFYIFFFARKGR
ncbi:hypothetical protein ACJX0J_012873, partial [Zea mays]